jgi:hypothetical protein
MLWTGIGLSFSTATYLRWLLLALCVVSLLFLIAKRLMRLRARFFNKEANPCTIK